jgi:hypothetical protein
MAILLDYLASKVGLEEPEIGSTNLNIQIDNNCKNLELHFGMPAGSGDYQDEGDESEDRDAILTASRRQRPMTELERFDLGTSDVDGYQDKDGDDADVNEEQEASQADDGTTQNVED